VAPCLTGEALDDRPVDETPHYRDEKQEPDPKPGQMCAPDPTGLPELFVTGRDPRHREDEPTEADSAKAGADADGHRRGQNP
jgi:hypothetical protein